MVFSGISYSRQQAMKRKKTLINKYRHQADEIIGHLSLLLKIDEKYQLVCELQSLIVAALHAAYQLAPEDPLTVNNLRIQKERYKALKEGRRENKVTCYATSDSELNQALSQISQIGKLLDICRNKGSLPVAKYQELQAHLETLKLNLNINSNLYQADSYAENGDVTMYQMHIKQALEILKKSPIEDKDKNSKIRQLSELLNEIKKTNKIISDQNFIKPTNEDAEKSDSSRKEVSPEETSVKEK